MARPLLLYLGSRLVVYAAIGVVIMLHIGLATQHFESPYFPDHAHSRPFFEALGMWDGGWYLHIAKYGYDTQLHPVGAFLPSVAFLPLLPLLVKVTALVTGLALLQAGIVTTFIVGAVATVCVWLFVRHLTDVPTADRATALWCFFPGAATLSLIYAEGLLVILAVACLYALLHRRWLVAGLAALLAGATAPEGLALVGACAWAAGAALLRPSPAPTLARAPVRTAIDSRQRRASTPLEQRRWLAPVAPLLAPVGFLAYQVFLWRRTGNLTYWYWAERQFWSGGFNPWRSTFGRVAQAYHHRACLISSCPASSWSCWWPPPSCCGGGSRPQW